MRPRSAPNNISHRLEGFLPRVGAHCVLLLDSHCGKPTLSSCPLQYLAPPTAFYFLLSIRRFLQVRNQALRPFRRNSKKAILQLLPLNRRFLSPARRLLYCRPVAKSEALCGVCLQIQKFMIYTGIHEIIILIFIQKIICKSVQNSLIINY